MPPSPRKTIDPGFIADLACPICGQDQLAIKSLANYPDFVTCSNCGSQFAVEDGGERVMFGKIPPTYSRTSRFALQQWVWPEAIARRAQEERPQAGLPPSTVPGPESPSPIASPSMEEAVEPASASPDLGTEAEAPAAESAIEVEPAGAEPPAMPAELDTEPEAAAEVDQLESSEEPAVEPPAVEDVEEDFLDDLTAEMEGDTLEPGVSDSPAAEMEDTTYDAEQEWPPSAIEHPAEPAEDSSLGEKTLAGLTDLPDEPGVTEADMAIEASEAELEDESSDDWEAFAAQVGTPSGGEEADDEDPFAELRRLGDEDFADFEAGLDSEDDESWEEEQDEFDGLGEGIFTPPFGEEEEAEADELPADFEPAPPMPDWLGSQAEAADESSLEDDDMAAIDFSGLRDEPTAEEADTSFGEEEDLLASLWDDEEEEAADFSSIDEGSEIEEDALAGFAGLGAIAADTAATEMEAEPEPEAVDDRWTEQAGSMAGMASGTPEAPTELDSAEEEIARVQWGGEQAGQEKEEPQLVEESGEEASFEPEEPPPGERYRVVLQNHQAQLPEALCAHCSQSPTVARLPITASVYRGAGVGDRQVITYRLPVCAECRDRAKARSDERQTAQLQAHLISVLVAMILVVSALAFRLVDFQEQIGFDLAILLLLAGMGYAIPAAFLLIRASRIGKPADAKYVESTLRVPGDTEGAETAFEFRNERYAHYFLKQNEKTAVSRVNKVRERQYEQEAD